MIPLLGRFVGVKWHYCLPFMEDPEFDLCRIGEMQENTIQNFIEKKPVLQKIREHGVITTVENYKEKLSDEMKGKLREVFSENRHVSVAYRGCMICKKLADLGIWKEIEALV